MRINRKNKIIGLLISFGFIFLCGNIFAEKDIMEVIFQPTKEYDKMIDLGTTKNDVGNEVFRESQQFGIEENFGKGCFVNGQLISNDNLNTQKNKVGFSGDKTLFCEKILGGNMDKSMIVSQKQAPLIIRITKFILRLTMVLSITMVLFNGIMWIVESSNGGEIKKTKDNLIYILVGILVSLSSVAIINLISSISISSLGT